MFTKFCASSTSNTSVDCLSALTNNKITKIAYAQLNICNTLRPDITKLTLDYYGRPYVPDHSSIVGVVMFNDTVTADDLYAVTTTFPLTNVMFSPLKKGHFLDEYLDSYLQGQFQQMTAAAAVNYKVQHKMEATDYYYNKGPYIIDYVNQLRYIYGNKATKLH